MTIFVLCWLNLPISFQFKSTFSTFVSEHVLYMALTTTRKSSPLTCSTSDQMILKLKLLRFQSVHFHFWDKKCKKNGRSGETFQSRNCNVYSEICMSQVFMVKIEFLFGEKRWWGPTFFKSNLLQLVHWLANWSERLYKQWLEFLQICKITFCMGWKHLFWHIFTKILICWGNKFKEQIKGQGKKYRKVGDTVLTSNSRNHWLSMSLLSASRFQSIFLQKFLTNQWIYNDL